MIEESQFNGLDEDEISDRVRNARDAKLPGKMAMDINAKRLHWLWPKRLARRKVNGLQGDPGEGKSLITIDIAARVSRGDDFPDGASCEAGNVIIISSEDDGDDTLRPRLEAAGADLSRIRLWTIIDGLPTFPKDLSKLAEVIKADKAALVILDPLEAFLDEKTDPNSNPSVRRVLAKLAKLATQFDCCILIVRHLSKDPKITNAKYRGSGSIAITGAARLNWHAGSTPKEPDNHVFALVKSNLSKAAGALGYRIVDAIITDQHGEKIETARIEWTGAIGTSANELLQAPEPEKRGPNPAKLETAIAFLREALKDGLPHESEPLTEEAKKQGIARGTLWNAQKELGVRPKKLGFAGGWAWILDQTEQPTETPTAEPRAREGSPETLDLRPANLHK